MASTSHQKLLSTLTCRARESKVKSGVITFNDHPLGLLGRAAPGMITTPEQKNLLIRSMGVDYITSLDFTEELSHTSARHFCQLMQNKLGMQGLVLGYDFAMGHKREGSLDTMQALGKEMAFSVEIVSPMFIEGEIFSSTSIREAISSGNLRKANTQLGHFYQLQGQVIKGRGLGQQLGFPTANIVINPQVLVPPNGIYASLAYVEGWRMPAATNIGTAPTFGGTERLIEVHLIDYDGNLYDKQLQVDFVDRIRDEIKFSHVDELKQRIAQDIQQTRLILERTF